MAILLTYETALVLLAGDTEVREEYMASGPTRGLKRSSGFESTKSSDLRFRVQLADEKGAARFDV